MTTPTAPDGDRLPATNSGQETAGHDFKWRRNGPGGATRCTQCDLWIGKWIGTPCPASQQPPAQEREDVVTPTGYVPPVSNGHTWPCTRFYVGSTDRDRCTCPPAPPSGADSAGEDAVVWQIANRYRDPAMVRFGINDYRDHLAASPDVQGEVEAWADLLVRRILNTVDPLGSGADVRQQCVAVVRELAASSGVQGGDGEARERLAAAWDEGYTDGKRGERRRPNPYGAAGGSR